MSKGENSAKKIHLRRCALCQKVGHNKSTCPEAVLQINTEKTVHQPLKFFVHHVNYNNHQSPHLVNLKEHKKSLYEDVQPVAPKQNTDFYFDHDTPGPSFSPKQKKSTPKSTPRFVRSKFPNLKENIKNAINKIGGSAFVNFIFIICAHKRAHLLF